MTRYDEFVHAKLAIRPPVGLTGEVSLPDSLFPHQKALTSWALKRGRAAIFAVGSVANIKTRPALGKRCRPQG
jgi:hypothetical protein